MLTFSTNLKTASVIWIQPFLRSTKHKCKHPRRCFCMFVCWNEQYNIQYQFFLLALVHIGDFFIYLRCHLQTLVLLTAPWPWRWRTSTGPTPSASSGWGWGVEEETIWLPTCGWSDPTWKFSQWIPDSMQKKSYLDKWRKARPCRQALHWYYRSE